MNENSQHVKQKKQKKKAEKGTFLIIKRIFYELSNVATHETDIWAHINQHIPRVDR